MKIEDLGSETQAERARVAASVIWEDATVPPKVVVCESSMIASPCLGSIK